MSLQQRILVVDDEPSICEGVANILSNAGFVVKQASSGEEAVRMAVGEEFDVVIMDLIMPGMDGADACAEIIRLRPDIKVIAISGSPVGQGMDKFVRSGGVELFLYKPFGKKELLAGVNDAIQSAKFHR
ncbi:MAG: response regulator [bacterium]